MQSGDYGSGAGYVDSDSDEVPGLLSNDSESDSGSRHQMSLSRALVLAAE